MDNFDYNNHSDLVNILPKDNKPKNIKNRDTGQSDRINLDLKNIKPLKAKAKKGLRDTGKNDRQLIEAKPVVVDVRNEVFADRLIFHPLPKSIKRDLPKEQVIQAKAVKVKTAQGVNQDTNFGISKDIVYPNQPVIFDPYKEDSDFIHNDTVLVRRGKPLDFTGGAAVYPRTSAYFMQIESVQIGAMDSDTDPTYFTEVYFSPQVLDDFLVPTFMTFLNERIHQYFEVWLNDRRLFIEFTGDWTSAPYPITDPDVTANLIVNNGIVEMFFKTAVFENDRLLFIFNSLTKAS
jgi:hypothetical protein